jgi:PKD repeat protein
MVVAVTAMMMTSLLVGVHGEVGAEGENKAPDLHVEAFYNYTRVVSGNETWFNLTIHNQGDAAFLVRTYGALEIYAYKDDEPQVAVFERVYEDVYVNQSLVIDFKIIFDTLGPHSLTAVIDGANMVSESNEDNNVATCSFTVISADSNRRPKADGGNDRTGYLGKGVLFSGKYSSDPDRDPLTYEWDFGDGSKGTGMRLHHTYEELGDYAASLTVSDGMYTDTDAFTVHIIEAPSNKAPTAIILASSKNVLVNDPVTLDGTASMDLDGDELEFEWTIATGPSDAERIRGEKVIHSWDSPGRYKVTLEVSDGTDESTTDVNIEVGSPPPPNEPPVANAGADLTIVKGTEWTLRGVGYDTDGIITSYEWDLDGDGVYDTYDETGGSISHKFEDPGYVTVKLRVTDDKGGTHVDSMVITVKDQKSDDKATPGLPTFAVIIAVLGAALLARTGRIGGSWQRFQR